MPPPFPGGEQIILRRVVLDRDGGERQVDAYGVLLTRTEDEIITGAAIWPSSSTEVAQNQERSRIAYTVLLPAEVSIDTVDRVVWRGREYDIEGEPQRYQSPFTDTALQTVQMYRVEG